MQGGDSVEVEAQPNNGLEGIDEPPLPTLARENEIKIQENEVDMREEGVTGEKRGQLECGERLGKGKLWRREGIKWSLRDITPVSYEEYDNSWTFRANQRSVKAWRIAYWPAANVEARVSQSGKRKETCRYI